MEIWEPKPPGTLWATPGLLPDCFTFPSLLGITKFDKQKNQCIRGKKTGAQDIVKEIKQYQKSGYNTYTEWTQTEYQNKHYSIDQKDEGT
jgi:hypothetical protein